MLSWQFRLFELYFRLQRAFAPGAGKVDVSRERVELDGLGAMFKPPGGIRVEKTVAGGVPAELLTPSGLPDPRVVLYLHGGSYICGSPASHRSLAGNIAIASRARALVIDYRLAPEHPHPAAVEDALAAYRWLLDNQAAPRHIAVAGDSAGGGLLLALLVSLRDQGLPLPAAAYAFHPGLTWRLPASPGTAKPLSTWLSTGTRKWNLPVCTWAGLIRRHLWFHRFTPT